MKHYLIVVDMQKDFVDGSLGTPEAQAIVENVVKKIEAHEGPILATLDTHTPDYLKTAEGRKLPVVHCVRGTPGWELDARVATALSKREHALVEKPSFGSVELPGRIDADGEDLRIELIGLCTDICVISNALILKAHFPEAELCVDARCCAGVTPEAELCVDARCCAGVTPEAHRAALAVLRSCQVDVTGES